jgi:hypothetical protein
MRGEKEMKKLLTIAALLLGGVLCSSSADRRNFWLLNNTGRKINGVFLAAHGVDVPWGEDILGQSVLPSAAGTVVYFLDSSFRCVYDFRIEYGDGSHEDYLKGRDLCESHAIQFNAGTNDAF